jgi:hypothetical protein
VNRLEEEIKEVEMIDTRVNPKQNRNGRVAMLA